jgi:hypothetical protein
MVGIERNPMHDEVKKFLKEIQSRGGKATRDRHPDHFKEMNRKSNEAKKAKKVDKSVDSL